MPILPGVAKHFDRAGSPLIDQNPEWKPEPYSAPEWVVEYGNDGIAKRMRWVSPRDRKKIEDAYNANPSGRI